MKFLLLIIILLVTITAHAQTAKDSSNTKMSIQDTTIYSEVMLESAYPGGQYTWKRFLDKNMHNPNRSGSKIEVEVQFVVSTEGHVDDIIITNGPAEGGYREEAIRLIKKSGRWTAAFQNGHVVRSYKKLTIEF